MPDSRARGAVGTDTSGLAIVDAEATPPRARRAGVRTWLTDMDGVLVSEGRAVPGAGELLRRGRRGGLRYLVLTNNSMYTPRDLSARLHRVGIPVDESQIWTSALATAHFLQRQHPKGTAFVVGEAGLTTALHEAGFILTDRNPDFVVVGETRSYSFEAITTAIRLIMDGSRFIATNPDPTGPSPTGPLPATGAIAALMTKASGGVEPYVVGKPNPMMFRSAMTRIGAHSESTGMIGDRMDTDVVAGIEAGLHTVLVLTGISDRASISRFPYRPDEVLDSIADVLG